MEAINATGRQMYHQKDEKDVNSSRTHENCYKTINGTLEAAVRVISTRLARFAALARSNLFDLQQR